MKLHTVVQLLAHTYIEIGSSRNSPNLYLALIPYRFYRMVLYMLLKLDQGVGLVKLVVGLLVFYLILPLVPVLVPALVAAAQDHYHTH